MPDLWTPDWVVSPDIARALIEDAWPELAPAKVIHFGTGWDNTGYLVNDSLVFRFPRRKVAVPLIQTEIALLPWLAPQLPLSIPTPYYVGVPSRSYPCPFSGYPKIHGRTLTTAQVSDSDRCAMARPLARFLSALHSISVADAKALGTPQDEFARMDLVKRRARTRERLDVIVAAGISCNTERIEFLLDTLPVIERPRSDTLVHGDLHSSQVIVDDQQKLVGVVDWGDAHIGDPALDFSGVLAMLPIECHRHFIQEYGPIDDATWAAARGRALWHAVAVLAQGVDVGDTDRVLEARSCLERLI